MRSPRQQQLVKHMLAKPEVDYSKLLVSPMPGRLVSLAVKEGQHVELGQELAVVEAMKMQNVLRSTRKGKVGKIEAEEGATLAVDQIIMSFEDEE